MSTINVKVKGLDKILSNLKRYPDIANPIFADAINQELAEIHKLARDSGPARSGVFQFKHSRMQRTGFLAESFAFGLRTATPSRLIGRIGPTAPYATFVHDGTRYIRGNPFMERILKAATPMIDKHFKMALEKVAEALTK